LIRRQELTSADQSIIGATDIKREINSPTLLSLNCSDRNMLLFT
jgi:hypothetical protein